MLDSKWLTLEETAKVTGYTDSYLRRLLRNGELAGQKLTPRLWVIERKAAEALAKKPYKRGRPRARTPQNIGKNGILKKT